MPEARAVFHEYPKALYRGSEMLVVADAAEEAAARAEGFHMLGEAAPPPAPEPRRRGRPPRERDA